MCWPEKWTLSRGRSGVPATFLRRRMCRSLRGEIFRVAILLNGFAFLPNHLLACIADTLTLIRFRWVVRANICGHLTNEMFVDSFDLDLRVLCNRHFDPLGNGEQDGMREAEGEV